MEYYAHSARDGFPAQLYADHINDVRKDAEKNAADAGRYCVLDAELMKTVVRDSACFHDLGKLLNENQKTLHKKDCKEKLPVNHADAGAAFFKGQTGDNGISTLLVYSHHRGLPDIPSEENYRITYLRDKDKSVRDLVDKQLEQLVQIHTSLTGRGLPANELMEAKGNVAVLVRMMLSCLADADHSDTARHYGKYPKDQSAPLLNAQERLDMLNEYISQFKQTDERSMLRSEMYTSCRDSSVQANICACDSPVGSGKTTAVMANLLRRAIHRKARRVFVTLPFTNIISQSVKTYRDALVLPGENPEDVVAELHHRADFESEEARAFSSQWKAPIIVTTATAFFETIASNKPATLRKLHELPGSVIFVDEAHAALPVKLLPLAWEWMQILAEEWNCYWVLASGSLVKFWEIEELTKTKRFIPQIVNDDLRNKLAQYEHKRIVFSYIASPLSKDDLVERVISSPGPRLLIMNTVQSAGVMAEMICRKYQPSVDLITIKKEHVLHLSTALCAEDRESVIEEVKTRLSDQNDTDWTLVATSCVEAGVDFSFRTGFREIASLLSLLQAAGRVNRNGNYADAEIFSFAMQDDPTLSKNPGLSDSSYVLTRYFQRQKQIAPELSTQAIIDETRRVSKDYSELLSAEKNNCFEKVETGFKVIDDNSVIVIADSELKQKIRFGQCDWREIQKKGISVRKKWVQEMRLPKLLNDTELYDWNMSYDRFLGVMAGRLEYQNALNGFLAP